MMKRRAQQRSRIPQKRRPAVRRVRRTTCWRCALLRAVFALAVVSYGALCGWVFLLWDGTRVRHIVVEGTSRLAPEAVRAQVRAMLDGTLWRHVPRAQFVLVRAPAVTDAVRAVSGVVRDVTVRKVFPDTLVVRVTEWQHVYVWCLRVDGTCYRMEDDGRLGARVPEDAPLLRDNPVTRVWDEGTPPTSVQRITSPVTPSLLAEIAAQFAAAGVPVRTDAVTVTHRHAPDLTLTTEEGWRIRLSARQAPARTARIVRGVLQQALTPEERAALRVVDARFGHKVFYRTQQSEAQAAEEAAAQAAEAASYAP